MSDIVDSAVVKVKADMSGFVESLTAAKETVSELNRELERTVELAYAAAVSVSCLDGGAGAFHQWFKTSGLIPPDDTSSDSPS